MYSLADGAFLIKLGRTAILKYLTEEISISPPDDTPDKLMEKAGVFITLENYPKKDLRGCIGYPEPTFPLAFAAIKAAISAAVDDPRFPPISQAEFEKIIVEITLLTPPELINASSPKEYLDHIKIGRDGLIVHLGLRRGLLLPQVPIQQGWNKEEYLSYTCIKAGLKGDCWMDSSAKLYKFSGLVFAEAEPDGKVKERILTSSP
ncbi:MAG: TIGR00296 family protein [Candidatus Hydrothermarchaeaceae archaeon]